MKEPWLTLAVVGALMQGNNLLLVQTHQGGDKKWQLPGGFLEKGESPDHGIIREIYEELHVDAKIIKRLGIYLRLWNGDAAIAFLIDVPQILPFSPISAYDDAKAAAFFPVKALPNITLRTQRIIDDILNCCTSNLYVFCDSNDTGRLV